MSTETKRTCPSCGNEFSGAMEFCPVCMLRRGLAGGVASGESSFEEPRKPTPDQSAQRFDHYGQRLIAEFAEFANCFHELSKRELSIRYDFTYTIFHDPPLEIDRFSRGHRKLDARHVVEAEPK